MFEGVTQGAQYEATFGLAALGMLLKSYLTKTVAETGPEKAAAARRVRKALFIGSG